LGLHFFWHSCWQENGDSKRKDGFSRTSGLENHDFSWLSVQISHPFSFAGAAFGILRKGEIVISFLREGNEKKRVPDLLLQMIRCISPFGGK
jgi:hypothetical protein